jgi:diguanylate cyclase (GGDEF)-like protein
LLLNLAGVIGEGFHQMSGNQGLDNLIQLVSNVTDAHTSALFWLDEGQNLLRLKAVYSLSPHLRPDASIELGCGLVGWVAKNAKPVNVAKFNHDPKTLRYYATEENIKSFVAVPVISNGKLVGVLSADSKRNYLFTDKHQKLLSGFAQQFRHLIECQQELEKVSEQARGYNRLHELCRRLAGSNGDNIFSTLLDVSRDILGFDDFVAALLNEARTRLQVKLACGEECAGYLDKWFPADQGLAGVMLKQKKTLLLNNLSQRKGKGFVFGRQGPRWEMDSFLGVPLACAGRTIGILAYTSRHPTAFSQQDKQLVTVMGLQAAAIISQWQMRQAKKSRRRQDGVTGLLNHSAFQQQLKQRLQQATLSHPLSLLLIGVDNLAGINHQHGYEAGDEILRKVARILLEVAPDNESAGRFGGKRFGLSLENTKPKAAKEVVRRIYHIIDHSRFVVGGEDIKVTVNIGLAVCPLDALNLPQLIDYTQRALELAKKKRQERICTFDDLLTEVST